MPPKRKGRKWTSMEENCIGVGSIGTSITNTTLTTTQLNQRLGQHLSLPHSLPRVLLRTPRISRLTCLRLIHHLGLLLILPRDLPQGLPKILRIIRFLCQPESQRQTQRQTRLRRPLYVLHLPRLSVRRILLRNRQRTTQPMHQPICHQQAQLPHPQLRHLRNPLLPQSPRKRNLKNPRKPRSHPQTLPPSLPSVDRTLIRLQVAVMVHQRSMTSFVPRAMRTYWESFVQRSKPKVSSPLWRIATVV